MVGAVVLNGVSSVGKTSIVRAMHAVIPTLRTIAMDDHLATLPAESFGTPDGLTFITNIVAGVPCTQVIAGPLVHAALDTMRGEVAACVRAGCRVVVDDVMLADTDEAAYRRLLPEGAIAIVAVRASLPAIEARERRRGDRMLGLARWQFERVHAGRSYDLEIDTTDTAPEESAADIIAAVGWSSSAFEDRAGARR